MAERYADFHLEVRGNTLLIKVTGPTGIDELTWLRRQIEDRHLKFLSKPWAILGDARDWELFTPEALALIEDFSDWAQKHGMTFNVLIAPENSVQLKAAKDFRLTNSIQTHYVTSMEEAIEWLTDRKIWGELKQ